ncbi:MAG: hypothetical protein AAFQ73_13710 [Pseudomonadota bacterium]
MKPERWKDPANKLFPKQVGFTSPPHDFDAAPTDFLRIAPETVGAHGRMLHVPGYAHQLSQRVDNFSLLEEFVECMSNNGADVCGQVGTNWSHAGGKTPKDIRAFCDRMADTYETPLHMAGMSLVDALRAMNVEKIALNSVYYWPDWRDGIARFLRDAGFDLLYAGNFVDLGLYDTQEQVNALTWIFPGAHAAESMRRTAERAPGAEAIVVNGMPNFRRRNDDGSDGLPERMLARTPEVEELTGLPVVSSDTALYWNIFRTLETAPAKGHGRLLDSLEHA